VNENEMGKACSTHGGYVECMKYIRLKTLEGMNG
jgi:hypothetical protein